MQRIELDKFGVENLKRVDGPQPKAGPGQVLVRMRAAAVNYRDFLIAQGYYKQDLPLPLIPLSDGAGEVVEVGAGVVSVASGDRVSSVFFQNWDSGPATLPRISVSTGCEAPGVLAELAVLPEQAIVPIPAQMTFSEAAALPCAGVTAWRALSLGNCKAGDTVLVLGTGGVALCALQFAKAMGARVIVTSSSDEKLERASILGADHAINYQKDPEWGKTAFGLAGFGVNLIVESGGAGTLSQSIAALGWDGHIAYIGSLTGFSAELNLLGIVGKNAHLHGLTVGSRQDHRDMLAFVSKHGIKPVLDDRRSLKDGADAIQSIATGKHFGKIVVTIP
ncbi:MAG: NAD(P)-dependent alcohol dehydrogenase [Gammaproteobacteria bacterium]